MFSCSFVTAAVHCVTAIPGERLCGSFQLPETMYVPSGCIQLTDKEGFQVKGIRLSLTPSRSSWNALQNNMLQRIHFSSNCIQNWIVCICSHDFSIKGICRKSFGRNEDFAASGVFASCALSWRGSTLCHYDQNCPDENQETKSTDLTHIHTHIHSS